MPTRHDDLAPAVAAALEQAAPSSAASGFPDYDQTAKARTGSMMNPALGEEFGVVTTARQDAAIDQAVGAHFFLKAAGTLDEPVSVLRDAPSPLAHDAQAPEPASC